MSFIEGEIFTEGDYSWQIDHLNGLPAKIQTILSYEETFAGIWLFKPDTLLEDIKTTMSEKIVESKAIRAKMSVKTTA